MNQSSWTGCRPEYLWRLLSKEYSDLADGAKDGKVYAELAVRAGREAVRLAKTRAAAWETLGEALMVNVYAEFAVRAGRDRLGKTFADSRETRGESIMKATQSGAGKAIVAEAEEAFSTVLSLVATPDSYNEEMMMVNALLARASIREAQGRFKEALADVRKARVGTPEDVLKNRGVNPQEIEFMIRKRSQENVELKRMEQVEQRLLGKLGKKPGAR